MLLKQSTAVVISFGPFVDKADGVTLETGLVSALDHASTGILLSKNGGTLTIRHATVTASTYDAHGCYKVTLDATDTNTLGSLRVVYTDAATCLPVWMDFQIVPAMIYDSLVLGTDDLDTNTKKWNDLTTVALPLVPTTAGRTLDVSAGGEAGIDWANVGSPTSTVDLSATTVNLVNTLTTYTSNTPQSGDAYAVVNSGTHGNAVLLSLVDDIGVAGAGLTAVPWNAAWDAEVQSECEDALSAYGASTHTAAAVWAVATRELTSGANIQLPSNGLANITAWTVDVTGNLSGSVGSVTSAVTLPTIPTNWITADGLAADAGSEIAAAVRSELTTELGRIDVASSTLATATDLATVAGYLDTEIAAIKAKTDQFVFTIANQVDANALTGGGSGLDAAGVRAAVGLASANLDTQLGDLPTAGENATEIASVLATAHGAGSWATATGFSTHSAADVWGVATRVLTAGTNIQLPSNGLANITAWTVNVTGNLSGSVGSVTSAVTLPTIPTNWITADGIATDAIGSAELSAAAATKIANAVEAEIIDETDSEKVLTAITDKIAAVNPDLSGLTLAAIASSVWANGTRTLTAGTNIQLPSNGLANITAWTVNVTGNLSGSVGSVTAAVTLPTIPTNWIVAAGIATDAGSEIAAAVRTELTTELGRIDVATSTRASAANLATLQTTANDLPTLAEILAGEGDTGVSLAKALEMLAAFIAGKVSVSSSAGVSTYSFKKRDGTTVSFTSHAKETSPIGTRTTTGSLS